MTDPKLFNVCTGTTDLHVASSNSGVCVCVLGRVVAVVYGVGLRSSTALTMH